MFSVVLFAAFALQQSPAPAQTPPPTPVPASSAAPASAASPDGAVQVAVAEPSPIQQVCRMEPVTGSRFGRRVCRNAVETAEERRESQEMLRRMQGSRMPDGQ